MEYTYLGRTGVQVSRICLGCMSYGSSDWRPWVLDEEAAQPFFRRAVEAGINFFDTANVYSFGESERVTGRALAKYAKRDEAVIATKVYFPMGRGPNTSGLSRKHVQQACEDSLRRLGVDTIDLYQIHRLDPHTPMEEIVAGLDSLVRAGKVRYLGASSMFAWQVMKALGVSALRGMESFVSVQPHYNLVYREEEREMLPLCLSEGLAVLPWSPLARGLLAGARKALDDRESTARAQSDAFSGGLYDEPSDWSVVEAVKGVAQQTGQQPAQVSLAWLLHQPAVTAPIIGATKLDHLDAAIDAVNLSLGDSELEILEAPYRPHAVKGIHTPNIPLGGGLNRPTT